VDSVSSPELAALFRRVSDYVNMKGATDALRIETRMRHVVELCKTAVKIERASEKPRKSRIKTFGYRAEQLDKLIEAGFPDRVVVEALRYPRGFIARTLRGIEQAQRMSAQRRARQRPFRAYSPR
jgi:CO dehydrogenase/acetyl-CoA synthase alpha subunit